MGRKYYLDKLRGLVIIFVVFQHITSPNIKVLPIGFNWWTADFFLTFSTPAVPIFIMISGALLLSSQKEWSLSEFFLKRVKKVVIPFIAWVLIYYFFNSYFMHDKFQLNEFIKEVIKGSNTRHLPQHLWFMPMIISLYLVTPILKRFLENATHSEKTYFLVMSILFGILIPIFQKFTDITIPYEAFIFSALYYFMGYFMINLSDGWISRKILLFSIFITGFLFASIGTYYLAVSLGKYDGFWFTGQSPGIFLMSISVFMLFKCFFFQAPKTILGKLFSYLGRISFGIYLIHQFWIYIILNGLFTGFRMGSLFPNLITGLPTITLMILVMSAISVHLIKYIPYGKYIIPE